MTGYKIVIGPVLVIVLAAALFVYFNKSSQSTTMKTQNFSCADISEVSFSYPVAEGWEVVSTKGVTTGDKTECVISLQAPNGTQVTKEPKIIVIKQQASETDAAAVPNPNGVPYTYMKENSLHEIQNNAYASFYGKEFTYWVQLDGITESQGFPVEEFFKQVTETFKVL